MRARRFLSPFLFLVLLSISLSHCGEEKKKERKSKKVDQLVQELTKGRDARKAAREQLVALGRDVTDDLLRHFDSPEFTVRWEVSNILGILEDPKGVGPLVERVLRDDNSHVRWRSLWALSQIEDPTITDRFRKALEKEEGSARWNAAVGCSMFDVREGLPVIYEGLKSKDQFVAWEAVNALSRMHEKESVKHLREVLDGSSVRFKRECAVSLGKMKYPEARETLVDLLDDEDAGVRWRAAMSLSNFKDDVTRKALEARLEVEKDDDVLRHLHSSLKQLK